MVFIYVNDILVTSSNTKLVERVIYLLESKFALKDLGEFNYFLGLEVTPFVQWLHLSQTNYIGDLLKKSKMIKNNRC